MSLYATAVYKPLSGTNLAHSFCSPYGNLIAYDKKLMMVFGVITLQCRDLWVWPERIQNTLQSLYLGDKHLFFHAVFPP